MILAGIAANTGFAAREIDGFGLAEVRFWWNALVEYRRRCRDNS